MDTVEQRTVTRSQKPGAEVAEAVKKTATKAKKTVTKAKKTVTKKPASEAPRKHKSYQGPLQPGKRSARVSPRKVMEKRRKQLQKKAEEKRIETAKRARAHNFSMLKAHKHVTIAGREYKLVVADRKLTPYAKFVKSNMKQLQRDRDGKLVFPQNWKGHQLGCSSDAFSAIAKYWKKTKAYMQDVEESVGTATLEQKKVKKAGSKRPRSPHSPRKAKKAKLSPRRPHRQDVEESVATLEQKKVKKAKKLSPRKKQSPRPRRH